MEFFKNRFVAVILAAIVVVGATFASASIKLGSAAQKITDGFFNGVTYDDYEHPSIQSQLKNISVAANGLASIAKNYAGVNADAVQQDRAMLDNSLKKGDISEIYESYCVTVSDCNSLVAAINGQNLSDRDASGVEQYASTINSAAGVIDKSGYNETVRDFMRSTYDVFPANIFGGLTGTDAPELFE